MSDKMKSIHKRILVNLGIAVAAVLFLIFVVPPLIRFFFPLIIAWIVAMMANPLIRFLERRIKIMRKHGSAIVIVLVLALICVVIYGLLAWGVSEVSALTRELPQIYASVTKNLQEALASIHKKVNIVPGNVQVFLNNGENALNELIIKGLNSVKESPFSTVGNVASSVVDGIVYAVLTILASYFMIVEKDNINTFVQDNVPEGISYFMEKIKAICKQALGGYFLAHFKIMIVIFFITIIPFVIMKIPYNGLLAAIIAVVDFLPFLGAGTVLGPWAIYLLITGSYRTAIVLIVLYFVIMVVRQLLEPKLVGDSLGIKPFQMVIFMLIGYRLMGMLGLIFSIPIGMMLIVCYREGMFERYIRGIKILAKDLNDYRKY